MALYCEAIVLSLGSGMAIKDVPYEMRNSDEPNSHQRYNLETQLREPTCLSVVTKICYKFLGSVYWQTVTVCK